MWYCNGNGGHYVDSESEFLGREFCSQHDSRIGAIVGRLAVLAFFIVILILAVSGFWVLFTETDPAYFDWCASYGC